MLPLSKTSSPNPTSHQKVSWDTHSQWLLYIFFWPILLCQPTILFPAPFLPDLFFPILNMSHLYAQKCIHMHSAYMYTCTCFTLNLPAVAEHYRLMQERWWYNSSCWTSRDKHNLSLSVQRARTRVSESRRSREWWNSWRRNTQLCKLCLSSRNLAIKLWVVFLLVLCSLIVQYDSSLC